MRKIDLHEAKIDLHAEGKVHAKAQWWETVWFVRKTPRALNMPWEPKKVVSRTGDSVSFLLYESHL